MSKLDLPIPVVVPPGARCPCVANHSPIPTRLEVHYVFPIGFGGPMAESNAVFVCPTARANILAYFNLLSRHMGSVPGEVQKKYSAFVRNVALKGWTQWRESTYRMI